MHAIVQQLLVLQRILLYYLHIRVGYYTTMVSFVGHSCCWTDSSSSTLVLVVLLATVLLIVTHK